MKIDKYIDDDKKMKQIRKDLINIIDSAPISYFVNSFFKDGLHIVTVNNEELIINLKFKGDKNED